MITSRAERIPETYAPPRHGTTEDNSAYWQSLSTDAQRHIVTHRPEWIANLDGVPSAVRHRANASRLAVEWEAVTGHLAQSQVNLAATPGWAVARRRRLRATIAALMRVLADLDAIEEAIRDRPLNPDNPSEGARLMVFTVPEKRSHATHAAIALGDVEHADHVGVAVPGMGSTVRGTLRGMVGEIALVRMLAHNELARYDRGTQTVAMVAWMGYQIPQSWSQVVAKRYAREAAPVLARFYRSIKVVSQNPGGVHLTALGHSYGSYVTALALQYASDRRSVDWVSGSPNDAQRIETQPVDDAVFYGSPGINATDEQELGLREGRGYVMRAPDDKIAWADTTRRFGKDPVQTGLEQLSTLATTTPDGVSREESRGHADYPRPGSNGRLRTAAYNMAIVVAGLGQEPGTLVR